MTPLLGLLLAASIDGGAALRHASALAALGPHPWGSPRNQAAAAYVAAQLREAGLEAVEVQAFERHGVRGANVIGTLPAPGEEFVVIGAHHDTAPEAPGAYDDGGGVGILIELARVLAQDERRARTIVFASFDGEEAWSTGKGTTAGSRAYLERLGPRARSMVAAFAIEMSGWKGGAPVLHPIAYADPREKGRAVIAPAWLVQAALEQQRSGTSIASSLQDIEDPSGELQRLAAAVQMAPERIVGREMSHDDAVRDLILYIWRRELKHERSQLMRDLQNHPDAKTQQLLRQLTSDIHLLKNWTDGSAVIGIRMAERASGMHPNA
jgi:hypothetical protein